MIEAGLDAPWPEDVLEALKPFLQGHLIEAPPFFYAADLRQPIWTATAVIAEAVEAGERGEDFVDVAAGDRPPYGIITTQSCDLAEERPQPRQPWIAVAPVYRIDVDSRLAQRDYVYELDPPRHAGERWIADLRIELPLEKGMLVGRTPIESFADEDGYIRFANHLARRRGRPALASVFHEVLSETTRTLKDDGNANRRLARNARAVVYKLMLSIQDGTRLKPSAAKLYVVTKGDPTGAKPWFDLWWNQARLVAEKHGLKLHAIGWLDSAAIDLELFDDLIEMRNPL